MDFKCLPLAVGSFPHKDAKRPLELIEENFNIIPLWPQLPQRSFKEQMYLQYSEGFPGLVVNEEEKKIFVNINDNFYEKNIQFYQNVIEENMDYFAISKDFALGLYEFIKLKDRWQKSIFIKGHLTGPISFALSVCDQNKKPLIHSAEAFEITSQIITMKLKWQADFLKKINSNVIIFIDEPYLASIDSGIINLNKDKIKEVLSQLINAAREVGVLTGIHCCGNTDWDFILKLMPDILSFDAYNYIENIIIYSNEIKKYISSGGSLAFGIVPTDKDKDGETSNSLLSLFDEILDKFQKKGIKKEIILNSSLITPACGMGSLSCDSSEEICKKTSMLSKLIREKYRRIF